MKKQRVILIISCISLLLVGGFLAQKSWQRPALLNFETSAPEGEYVIGLYGHSMDLTQDGGFIVAGYIKYHSKLKRDHDIWVVKVDAHGEQEWCNTFGGWSTDRAWAIQALEKDEYLMLGETRSFGDDYQGFLISLDGSGRQKWGSLIGSSGPYHGKDFILDDSGLLFITGSAWSDSLEREGYYFGRANSEGEMLFETTIDHELPGGAVSLTRLRDGDLVLLGNLQTEKDRSLDMGLVRLRPDGTVISTKRFGSVYSDEAKSIASTEDGGYLITGIEYNDETNKRDMVVYRFSVSDELEFKNYYGGASEDAGHKIIASSDGGYAVVGITQSFGQGFRDVYLIKISETGEVEWSQTYGGKKTEWAYDIKETADGGYLISSSSKSMGQNATDILIIKVDSNGNKVWERVYCGP